MKKEMLFGIKKINVFLICVMVTLTLLTGCSAGTPNADRIKNDLNASDIVGSKEFFGKNDAQMIPVTKVSIVDKTVEDDECEIKCNAVLEDDNYRIDAQVTVYYSKFDKWSFEKYDIGEHTIVPISGVPNYLIKQRAEYVATSSVGTLVENAQVTNVTHNFDANAKTDYVTFDLSAKGYTTKMNIKVSTGYSFENYWRVKDSDEEITSHEWLFNDLVGTEWSGSVGIGATRHIVINSVDTANKTMNVSYYSSQDDCSYEIANWYDDEAIKVHLPNESFTDQMWIFGDGEIRYGVPGGLGGMLGQRVDNKTKMDVIIDGAEDTPDSYEVSQSTSDEGNSLPIAPIAIAIIVAIIIIVVVAKKRTIKTVSSVGGSPDVVDEFVPPIAIDEKPATPPMFDGVIIDDESTSRLKKTFPPKSDDDGFTSSSDEKTGDWFKSAGDL